MSTDNFESQASGVNKKSTSVEHSRGTLHPARSSKKTEECYVYDDDIIADGGSNSFCDSRTSYSGSKGSVYATLGQLAEKIHAKAKADMKAKGMDEFYGSDDNDDEEIEGLCLIGEEHTGRWTKEEHSQFLEGLRKFGKVILLSSHLFHVGRKAQVFYFYFLHRSGKRSPLWLRQGL